MTEEPRKRAAMPPDSLRKMKLMCLGELAKRVVSIPASWSTVLVYDALVEDGTAAPVVNVNPFVRAFIITEQGRAFLKEMRP